MTSHQVLRFDGGTAEVYTTIESCRADWTSLTTGKLLLSTAFLEGLEEASIPEMAFRYLILKEGPQMVGVAYCQIYPFSIFESFKNLREGDRRWTTRLRQGLARRLPLKVLVCGNLLLTGPHGFHFVRPYTSAEKGRMLTSLWNTLFEQMPALDPSLNMMFVKELDAALDKEVGRSLSAQGFYRFQVQPSMAMVIDDRWTVYDDYTAALRSKYRLRLKKARERGQPLISQRLSVDQVRRQKGELHRLFSSVVDHADFHIVQVPKGFFASISSHMPDQFQVTAYYLDRQMVGFMTSLEDDRKLVAHFTGFDRTLNVSLDIYLNMMLDLVQQAITEHKRVLILSRTALEMKSAIGAVPAEMFGFLRHRNGLLNRMLPSIFGWFYRAEAWTQRHPFRREK